METIGFSRSAARALADGLRRDSQCAGIAVEQDTNGCWLVMGYSREGVFHVWDGLMLWVGHSEDDWKQGKEALAITPCYSASAFRTHIGVRNPDDLQRGSWYWIRDFTADDDDDFTADDDDRTS